jgi:glycosyltransferase involved in cell wall biosynthesis
MSPEPRCRDTPARPPLHRNARVCALVPHFRCEQWLHDCLASLAAQHRPPEAIVVIDDASAEPPRVVVERFDDVTLLVADENRGPYRLVQQVIDETDFDAYLFQDADDWSAPERLERLLAVAEETGAELIGSDYLLVATVDGRAVRHIFPPDPVAALRARPTCHALQHPTSLVARSLVTRLGGYATGMRFSGDDEFLRRAAYTGRIANVAEVLYYRRHREGSLTSAADTGHGSPARRAILDEMAARARSNVRAVEAGLPPDLTPLRTSAPVVLRHRSGPPLDGSATRRPPARPARRHAATADAADPKAAPGGGAVLVLGGPCSGADLLLWALAQHPALQAVPDAGWLLPLGAAADVRAGMGGGALQPAGEDAPVPASASLAGVAPAALTAAARTMLAGLLREAHPQARGWVVAVPPEEAAVAAALRLFPDAGVVHVVRDPDEFAACGGPRPGTDAYGEWVAAARALLDAERLVAPDRLRRVPYGQLRTDPAAALAGCLALLDLEPVPACTTPLLGLVDPTATGLPPPSPQRTQARTLAAALVGARWRRADEPLAAAPVGVGAAQQERAGDQPRPRGRRGHGKPDAAARPAAARPATSPAPRPAVHPTVPATLDLATTATPPGATIAVVSRGDDRLLELPGRRGWHFPQTSDGTYAGHHPDDSPAAIAQLADVVDRGAGFLLFPETSRWWLDHYAGLREHLERDHHLLADRAGAGVAFELRPRTRAAAAPPPRRRSRARASVTVVSWSAAHNPLGRAHLLAELLDGPFDVELVGGLFPQFGDDVWAPHRDTRLPLRTFPGEDLPDLYGHLEQMANSIRSDAVLVGKPRLPGLAIGVLSRVRQRRPLVLDVDDHEVAFVGGSGAVLLDEVRRQAGTPQARRPYGRLWTQFSQTLIPHADAVTVSNPTLQGLHGGVVVPHARDERLFDPSLYDRRRARAAYGFDDDERIVLFAGTPRRHKGVLEIARALREVGDPRNTLCLIGTRELDELAEDLAEVRDWIRPLPYQPFADLPVLLAAADLVCVLQDPQSPVAQYQMPAKVTDALAMGVPCLVNPLPPLADLVAGGHLEVLDGPLAPRLAALLPGDDARRRARGNREVFLDRFSYRAARPTLSAVVTAALDDPRPPAAELVELERFLHERYAGPATAAPAATAAPPAPAAISAPAAPAGADAPIDVVMFWKQQDSGLYGRRHDMLAQALAASGRVRRLVTFDQPISRAAVDALADARPLTHDRLVHEATLRRAQGEPCGPVMSRHTFVYDGGTDGPTRAPVMDGYLAYIERVLEQQGIGGQQTVFWVYPKNFSFPAIAERFRPDLVVADVVDDQRAWTRPGSDARERVRANYRDILGSSDLVLTNCETLRRAMSEFASGIELVPNAVELPDPAAQADVPDDIRSLPRPVVGYVGNLSARLDLPLIAKIATVRPEWSLVLIGSAHAGTDALALDRFPNVHLLGPRPHAEAKACIGGFDVAIIPHVDDEMTRAMNPLKAFVYAGLNVPVVSTPIANLAELAGMVAVAEDADDFVDKVAERIAAGRSPMTPAQVAVLRANSWETRVRQVLRLLTARLGSASAGVTP